MEDIFGMLNFLRENSTVSKICYTLVLGIYTLWILSCSMAGPMYHPGYPCCSHDVISFGLFWITNCAPGGASSVRL